jgi:hypothetical protein
MQKIRDQAGCVYLTSALLEKGSEWADYEIRFQISRRRREDGLDASTTEVGDEPVPEKERSSRKGSGNRSLRRQALDANGVRSDIEQNYQILSSELGQQRALVDKVKARHGVNSISGDDGDVSRQSRLGRTTSRSRKKRAGTCACISN